MRKKEKDIQIANNELDEAIAVVNAFVNGQYKSMYLMDSWTLIKEYISTHKE